MGEGADRVKNGSPDRVVSRVSGEIETLRGDLGSLVAELDRRRHEAFDLGLQVKRHPAVLIAAAAGAALLAGGLLALAIRARRRQRRPRVRAREARRAIARLLDHPERVAREASAGRKIAAAVGSLVATTLVKRLVLERAIKPAPASVR
jgi:hypothetical protein